MSRNKILSKRHITLPNNENYCQKKGKVKEQNKTIAIMKEHKGGPSFFTYVNSSWALRFFRDKISLRLTKLCYDLNNALKHPSIVKELSAWYGKLT